MFCARCGKEVAEESRFCASCGQEVSVSGAPASFRYGGFWVRFAAYLIDGLIVGIPIGLIAAMLIPLLVDFHSLLHRNPSMDPVDAAALFGHMLLIVAIIAVPFFIGNWLYFAVMESSKRQATFGKSLMSLYVTDAEAKRLSFGHASGRYFAKIVTGLIPFGIGYIMAGFTAKKQALHDFIAGTLVLRS